MQVVEQFTTSKTGQAADNEDGVLVTEHYACVVDGATSQSKRSWDGRRSGQLATETLLAALRRMPAELDADAAIGHLTAALAGAYRDRGVHDALAACPQDRWTAAVGLYSRYRGEVWLVGDCHTLFVLPDGQTQAFDNAKRVDTAIAAVRGLFLEAELRAGKSLEELLEHDPGAEFIRPLLYRQYAFQNSEVESTYAYWVLDGFPVAPRGIKRLTLPEGTREVILASDGYPVLRPTLAETETALRDELAADPLCIRLHPTVKGLAPGKVAYDDRSYLRIRLT